MTGSRPPDRPPAPRPRVSPRDASWQPRRPPVRVEETVAGDAILAGEPTTPSTPDLSTATAARLGGRAIAMAGIVVVAGVVLSRLLGWARTSVFFAEFGDGPDLNAFLAAFRIPDTLFQLVAAGALGSALVPVATALLANGEEARARRLVATIANLMIVGLVPLAILVWLVAPTLVPAIAPISDASKLPLEVELTRWMLLSPILLALAAAMTAGLNAAGIFGAPALAPNVYNAAIIACAVVLTPVMGVRALVLGVILGGVGHILTQVPAVRRNGLYSLTLDVHDPAVRETLLLMAPRALGLGATQIVFLVNTFFAVQLTGPDGQSGGGLSIYTGGFTALQIPVGLIGVPLGIVLLPPLSQAIARQDMARFRNLVDQSLRLLLYVTIPLTGLMAVLSAPGMTLLFQHGSFSKVDTSATVAVFLVFLVGLVAHVLISLVAPVFYAGKDTRTPVTAALLAVAVDVVAAALLFPAFHLEGLALAIGLGAWAEIGMLFFFLRRKQEFDLWPLTRTVIFAVPGAAICSAAALAAYRLAGGSASGSAPLLTLILQLAIAGCVGLAVYAAWSRLTKMPELSTSLDLVRTVVRR